MLLVFANSLLLNAMNALETREDDLTPEWFSDMVACDRAVLHALRQNDPTSVAPPLSHLPL